MAFIPAAFAAVGTAAGASAATAAATGAAIVGTTATLAGAGISAYGMIQQGRSQQRQAEYQAKVEENNAVSMGYAAIQEQQAATREAGVLQEQRLRVLGQQRSAVAASGLQLSGSALDVMGDTSIQAEKEIQMAMYRGQMGSYNAGNAGANYLANASLSRIAGHNYRTTSFYQAGSTLLGGAASAGLSYANFKRI